jgi:signal transduction histidine kinase
MTCVFSEAPSNKASDTHFPMKRMVGDLSCLGRQDSFTLHETLAKLVRCFDTDSSCFAVVIWDEFGKPFAVVSRDTLSYELTRPFTSELYKHKPVELFLKEVKTPFLMISGTETIDKAVASALARPARYRYEPVFVQGEDTWFLLETHDLLAQQCEVLSAIIDEVSLQRQKLIVAQLESERLHNQLVAASRDAGRAEVATGVLHNVGNVLNSVNASAALITRTIRESKLDNLNKALTMIREHDTNLGTFLTSDERGQRLPGYMIKLGEVLVAERMTVIEELRLMERSIDHIRQIVQMQQTYARSTCIFEPVNPTDIMEDALRVNLISCEKHNVAVQREYQEIGLVNLDKHKVLQILINLISNAKNACKLQSLDERHIVARILSVEGDGIPKVRFQIADNGIGIIPENMTKIFANGFTTRKDGHGFGLHSSANAAREMEGALSVVSEGLGLGAVFTLDIPHRKEQSS